MMLVMLAQFSKPLSNTDTRSLFVVPQRFTTNLKRQREQKQYIFQHNKKDEKVNVRERDGKFLTQLNDVVAFHSFLLCSSRSSSELNKNVLQIDFNCALTINERENNFRCMRMDRCELTVICHKLCVGFFIPFSLTRTKKIYMRTDVQMKTHIYTDSVESHANGVTDSNELTCGWRYFIAAVSKIL